MPSKGAKKKKRYRDSEGYDDDIELESYTKTQSRAMRKLPLYTKTENSGLGELPGEAVDRVKEEPKCRSVLFRYCLFLVVLSLGVGMVVNLYGTYG